MGRLISALSKYKSQVGLIERFLKAFVKTNGLFEELSSMDTAFIIDLDNHIIKGEFIKIGGLKPLEINFINQNSKYPPILFKFVGYKTNIVLFIKDINEISQKRTSLYLNRINSQISKSKIVVDFTDIDYNNFNDVYLNVESYFLLPLFPL